MLEFATIVPWLATARATTISEQLGTIKALNTALGGVDSTSTENLIAAFNVDYREDGQGLISLVRELTAENVRLVDKLETSGFSPFTEEVEDILRARVKTLESAIELMRVTGGREEFQMAFDLAKDLLKCTSHSNCPYVSRIDTFLSTRTPS